MFFISFKRNIYSLQSGIFCWKAFEMKSILYVYALNFFICFMILLEAAYGPEKKHSESSI
jgi:hypothetical protein